MLRWQRYTRGHSDLHYLPFSMPYFSPAVDSSADRIVTASPPYKHIDGLIRDEANVAKTRREPQLRYLFGYRPCAYSGTAHDDDLKDCITPTSP
ncbi:hypothetical protein H5410_042077 [Solanum commersonii]|uniref:Uncharacterized protein n=1 Tax=Solanum commersonii TaxID=4109 RepID=A0A9J5XTB5_SOLCO|nr:hypothetical protein H5410_042077 [Solanum commersonii]